MHRHCTYNATRFTEVERSNSLLMISFVKDKWYLTRAIIARLIDVFDRVNYISKSAFLFTRNVKIFRYFVLHFMNIETNYSSFYNLKNIENYIETMR